MTVALITDQHLDGRKGSLAFWNYFEKFYEEIFFPTLERQGITEIIDLGIHLTTGRALILMSGVGFVGLILIAWLAWVSLSI